MEKSKKDYKPSYEIGKVEYVMNQEQYKIAMRIEGQPVTAPRPRARMNFMQMNEDGKKVTRNKPVVYNEKAYEDWKKNLSKILKEQGFYDEPLLQEIFSDLNGVSFRIRCFYKPNKRNMEDRYYKTTVPDTDNLTKAYMDAIISDNMPINARTKNGIKDARVTHNECFKLFIQEEGIEPFVFIEMEPTVNRFDEMGRLIDWSEE